MESGERTGADRRVVTGTALVAGAATGVAGVWSLGWPRSFADAVDFPHHEHFLHDVGAFQLGLAVTLLLACVWYDAMATALAGFLVGNGVHTVNHAVDLDHGGQAWHVAALAVVSVAVAVALGLRLRQLGWVAGGITGTARTELAPYVRQKTVLLTTYRRDGRPGSSPVSIAVDGDHAYVRSFEKSLKTRRLRRDPSARIAPCDGRGGKLQGEELEVALHLLERGGPRDRHARRLLRQKYPLLHGVIVPFSHRAMRSKLGRTVHFRLEVR